ncbi:MAG: hypothetical protein ACI853_001095 [Paracoccaceae bacterium]|jgi:hypothetical protein
MTKQGADLDIRTENIPARYEREAECLFHTSAPFRHFLDMRPLCDAPLLAVQSISR